MLLCVCTWKRVGPLLTVRRVRGDSPQAVLQAGSLIAILGYLVPAPNQRLLLCGAGVALSLLVTMATWFQPAVRRDRAVGACATVSMSARRHTQTRMP
jgi:hypothetical protein